MSISNGTKTATKSAPDHLGNIPHELRKRNQWVVYKMPRKMPQRIDGQAASSTDDTTWTNFDDAVRACRGKKFAGVGYTFSPTDPYAGIDLDGCRNPDTGEVAKWATEIIEAIDSYTEVSPSQTGFKIIVKAKADDPKGHNEKLPDVPTMTDKKEPGIEVYSQGRYFTTTGQVVDGRDTINERTQAYNELYRRFWPKPEPKASTNGHAASNGQASNAVDRARKYIDKMPAAIAGQGGHNATFNVACELFRFGLSDGDAERLFREYNARCEPPWNDSDLGHKFRDAKKTVSAAGEFGSRLNEDRPASNGRRRKQRTFTAATAGDDLTLLNPQSWTDTGNAKRFTKLHGCDVRWCDPWGKWLVWDGRRWAIDDTRRVEHKAKDVSAAMFKELPALAAAMGDDAFDAAMRFAKNAGNERNIKSFLQLAKSESGIPLLPDVLDLDPMLLNVHNGTINLTTGELREHRRGDNLTKLAAVKFDPKARCRTWERFIGEVFGSSETLVEFMRRAIGYTLTGLTVERCIFFCYGTGRNGKTTLVSTVQKLLGDYATTLNTDALMVSFGQQHPTELTDLAGARLAVANETEDGRRFAESLLKQLTGGEDVIKARRMREDFWQFRATHKLWLCGNHKPNIRGTDPAIWDRMRLIPFNVRFDKPDKQLAAKLAAELPGILNWALVGLADWHAIGLKEPDEVKTATDKYRADMDVIGQFIGDCCIKNPGESVGATVLYKAYKAWAEDIGEKPCNQKRFGTAITEKGFGTDKTRDGTVRTGIGLTGNV